MRKLLILIVLIVATPSMLFAEPEYVQYESTRFVQKDNLFSLILPQGWTAQEIPGKVFILPPSSGGGIVIQFEPINNVKTFEETKAKISTMFKNIAEYKIKPAGGRVIEDKEFTIDNVYARCLYYSVYLKKHFMYFFSIVFENNGYTFSIDYGDESKDMVDEILNLVKELKF